MRIQYDQRTAPIIPTVVALLCCSIDVVSADESSRFKTLVLDGHGVRWRESRGVSYGVVTETVAFPGARNCRKMTTLDGLQTGSAIASTKLHAEIEKAFSMWQASANISFYPAEVPPAADILIGAQMEPEGWQTNLEASHSER